MEGPLNFMLSGPFLLGGVIMKKRIATVLITGVLAAFLTNPMDAAAEDLHLIIKKKGEVTEELNELNTRLSNLNELIDNMRKNEEQSKHLLNQFEDTIDKKNNEKNETFTEIQSKSISFLDNKEHLLSTANLLVQRKALLKKRLVALQDQSGLSLYLQVLLEAESMGNFFDHFSALRKVVEADRDLIKQTAQDQTDLELQIKTILTEYRDLQDIHSNKNIEIAEFQDKTMNESITLANIQKEINEALLQKGTLQEDQEKLKKEEAELSTLFESIQPVETNLPRGNGQGVPEYKEFYVRSSEKYGVDWEVLAAIHSVETSYSTHPMISSAGAIGPMQFLKLTWIGYSYDNGSGEPPAHLDITNIDVIKKGNGYGRDGDNDGIADPYNLADSIESAAYYLAQNGYSTNPANAIWHYNHAQWYVDKVLAEATTIKSSTGS